VQRNAVFYFIGLLALASAGFWPTYLAAPRIEADWHVHLHGLAMFGWMALLIAQAWLVRTRRLAAHRALGRVSYGLVPVIAVSTLLLAHYRMRGGLNVGLLYFFYVQVSLLAVFVASYALAIANRRRRQEPRVYPAMLAVFVATQLPTFFLYRTAAWRTLVESFAALPLP
jgi:uncharacterized membrane protein